VERRDIRDNKICRNKSISIHIVFANDFSIFATNESETLVMQHILAIYEAASEHAINFQKSELYCS
jgi:hypothetical protein